jgi:uncharacterized protein
LDEYTSPESEPQPAPTYPRGKFTALLVILVLFLVLVIVAQRGPRPTTEGSFSETVLYGDIYIKVSYAYQHWAPLLATMEKDRLQSFPESQRQEAIASYLEAAEEDPTPSTIRRLIIAEGPKEKASAIDKLTRLAKKRKSLFPEVGMWQTIYISRAPLPMSQVDAYQSKIRGLGLGWFQHLALADLYHGAGMRRDAAKERSDAAASAAHTVTLLSSLVAVVVLIGLAGVFVLIWFVQARQSGRLPAQDVESAVSEIDRSFIAGYLLEIFVFYLAATMGIQLAAAGLLRIDPALDKPGFAVLLVFGVYIGTGLVSFLYLRYRMRGAGWTWRTVGLTSRNLAKDIAWGIGGYAACLPLILIANSLSRLIGRYIETPSNPIVPLFIESTTVFQRMLIFLLAAVAAPFFEELFFRGALFHSFRAKWGVRLGIILSAVVFGLVHPLPLNFLPILVLGSVFATLANQRGSLLPSMIAHGLNNTFSFIFLLILVGS